jgi:iron(III) transport system substrate-binding protein
MKTFAKLLILAAIVVVAAACAPQTPAPPAATVAPTVNPAQDAWLKSAELGKYAPAKQDWAAIEAAAKKEGKVLVYANSSRIADAKKAFEKKYPGITLEAFDLGSEDSVLKIREEQKAGAYTGDVLFSSSAAGDVVAELLPKQMIWNFVPDTVDAVYPKPYKDPLLVSRMGVRVLAYNSELNKSCPVKNWWELTEPQWKGKVFIEDPLADASTMGILANIIAHPKDFADAYKEKYGKDIVLDKDTPDAGWMWLKLFAKNKPMPQPGGDDVTAAIASKGMKEAGVGFISYSKYRNVVAGKIVLEPCLGLKPVLGLQTQTYLAIANRAPHPNAAKLFINFITSKEGFEPWNVIGDYNPRTDLESPKGAIPYTELGKVVWTVDETVAFKTLGKVRDFYALNVLK